MSIRANSVPLLLPKVYVRSASHGDNDERDIRSLHDLDNETERGLRSQEHNRADWRSTLRYARVILRPEGEVDWIW
jgi:hypothetical protein